VKSIAHPTKKRSGQNSLTTPFLKQYISKVFYKIRFQKLTKFLEYIVTNNIYTFDSDAN